MLRAWTVEAECLCFVNRLTILRCPAAADGIEHYGDMLTRGSRGTQIRAIVPAVANDGPGQWHQDYFLVKAAGFRRQDFRVFVPDGFRELIALRKRQDGHARGDHGRWNLRASLPNLHTVLS
jgi:hypothetical protein